MDDNIVDVYLENYPYIDTWNEFDRFIEVEFEDRHEDLKNIDKFRLIQNTCDGRTYILREESQEEALKIWNKLYSDESQYERIHHPTYSKAMIHISNLRSIIDNIKKDIKYYELDDRFKRDFEKLEESSVESINYLNEMIKEIQKTYKMD